MRSIVIFLLTAISAFASEANFGKYDGTAVILDINSSKRIVFNDKRADERAAPYSTFKIINSIISLDTEASKTKNETF